MATPATSQQHVLRCPECDFVCLSNNQMCRHIFLTCHTLVSCSQCTTRLVCWGFAPGVKKLFEKGRRDNVLLDDIVLETAEKHFETTQHQNTNVPPKDAFMVAGAPESFGLQAAQPKMDPAVDPAAVRFRCPDCANTISTWTQMTRHLDATKHSLAKCAECGLALKCYGPAQPQRHEKMTGHRGMIGIFRQKSDYVVCGASQHPQVSERHARTAQYRCYCGVSFLHPLHIAEHLTSVHKFAPFADCACQECGIEGSVAEMLRHLDKYENHAEYDIPGLDEDDFLVRIPRTEVFSAAAAADAVVSATSSNISEHHRILYQCPDCCFIFTSWVRLEEHLVKTKHGLAFCVECRKHLRPSVRGDHGSATGHKNIIGVHLSRRDYEVLVNLDDAALRSQMDHADANTPEVGSSRLVFQCPLPTCRAVFSAYARFEDHLNNTRHGTISCTSCLSDLCVLDPQLIAEHEHPLEIPSHLRGKLSVEDFYVHACESDLVKHFPHEYIMCQRCNKAVSRRMYPRHENSSVCVAAASRLDLSEWDSPTPPGSAPGSFNNNVAPVSIPHYHPQAAKQPAAPSVFPQQQAHMVPNAQQNFNGLPAVMGPQGQQIFVVQQSAPSITGPPQYVWAPSM